ncbi:hypothetical protein CRM22_000523 [Opisthorchis felineus]|uniref:Major facilitator superfamily (MFS) profile domain-containing protein n=1 Tax=Opisthorchis felineus TaxID=147828 RepID=A0A4S2MEP3_OPIFE|nr:hypothetical protein CRM22_000523 [Opisthorchis felineus]
MELFGCCNDTVRGILCIIGGILIHITYGYFYTVGNMAPYIVDYMNSNNISVNKTSAVWLTSVGFSMQSIAMPLSAYIATKIGFRIVVICSCVLHSGSIALTYFAVGWGFWAVVLFYGIFTGIGFGAGYSVIIAAATEWFPNRRGLVVGLVLGGFGAGALIFIPVQTGFINPANLKINATTGSFTQPEILNRVPQAFLLLAGITATLQIIGILLMQEKSQSAIENEQLGPEGQNVPYSEDIYFDEEEKTTKRPNRYYVNWDRNRMVDVPPLTVFTALDFYLLWLSVCCGAIPITLVTSLYKVAGSRYIHDDAFLAGVSMAASLCNSVGRVIWGRVCDRISFKVPMCCMCILWTALLFSFPFISEFSDTAAKATFVLWVSFMFLCQCGIFVFAPTATATIFGAVNFAVNYGFVYTAFLVGSLVASMMTNLGSVGASIEIHFFVAGAMSLLSIVSILLVVDRKVPHAFKYLNALVRFRTRYLP